jgi:hypothetical protein
MMHGAHKELVKQPVLKRGLSALALANGIMVVEASLTVSSVLWTPLQSLHMCVCGLGVCFRLTQIVSLSAAFPSMWLQGS